MKSALSTLPFIIVCVGGCRSHTGLNQDLFKAASSGDVSSVNRLLKEGADPNANNGDAEFNFTVLETATEHPDVVRVLLKSGARPDQRDTHGGSALHYAAGANVDSTKLLLDAGVPVDFEDKGRATALEWAASEGRSDTAKLLLERGANPNHRDQFGWTPLIRSTFNDDYKSDPVGTVRVLLDNGADVHVKDAHGRTVIQWAQKQLKKSGQGRQIISLLEASALHKQ